MLHGLEKNQREKYPNLYAALEAKVRKKKDELNVLLAACTNEEEKTRVMMDFDQLADVDVEQPHDEFVLSRGGISKKEFDDICNEVYTNDKFPSLAATRSHALLRALRRGIGLYFDDVSLTTYKRVIMRLATKGKLAVVFSDESLAFGVNMPFRSCVFCGDMGGRLDPLLLQQMSGRAGRRGLDTQGHLIYAGAEADFVRNLMLSKIPAVVGTDPRYLTMFIPHMMSRYVNHPGFKHQTDTVGRNPLLLSVEGQRNAGMVPDAGNNINEISQTFLLEMKLIEECDVMDPGSEEAEAFNYSIRAFHENEGASPIGFRPRSGAPFYVNAVILWLIWDLRDKPASSLVLGIVMKTLFDKFASNRRLDYSESEDVQCEFFAVLLYLIDRHPVVGEVGGPSRFVLQDSPFIKKEGMDSRIELRNTLDTVHAKLLQYQSMLNDLPANFPMKDKYSLSVPVGETKESVPLDGLLFHCIVSKHTRDVPFNRRQEIKDRLWSVGSVLASLHNNCFPDREFPGYGSLQHMFRRCFTRIKYISKDHIRESIDFINISDFMYEGRDISNLDLFGRRPTEEEGPEINDESEFGPILEGDISGGGSSEN